MFKQGLWMIFVIELSKMSLETDSHGMFGFVYWKCVHADLPSTPFYHYLLSPL